uniref:Ig-like domain-containing protein n=1 Tax=Salmo trutta TaxID=8032 RepID=A0A673XWW0_SALTR
MTPLAVQCVHCQVVLTQSYELTQPASLTVQPGQPLTISCKVSYYVTSFYTTWIQQPAGKTLEWIGNVYSGNTEYKDSLKNKFSLSVDSSSNTVFLKGQNLQTEDTAVYYCAYPHSDITHHQRCTKTILLGDTV